jgi:fatty-acyl-CoA synthase
VLTVLPMFHVGGLNIQTTPALIAGATVTIHPRFAPGDTLAAIARERPTLVVLVPATLQAMMMHPDFARADLSSLRVITTGSTIVAESFVTAFATRGIRVIQVYGSTETCPVVVYERFDCPRVKPDTTGVAGLINEAAVVDDKGREVAPGEAGEIVVRGANLFSGYWRDPVATEAAFRDGWYLTGDIGTRDTDGHFAVRERKRNVIISGGENIYPAEVERVIGTFPGVADCAVVARADERWAEVPVAFVVPAPGAALDIGALERHVGASLARFKQPRAYHLREVLPKNALGKVQHFALKAELAAAGQ